MGRTAVRATNYRKGFDGNLADRLRSAGHGVSLSEAIGHAGTVVIHPDGAMEAAHDPRADGGAAGV